MTKKVALIIANIDFQPLEYGIPKAILEKNGIEVVTISDVSGIARAVSYDGSEASVDLALEDVKVQDYDGVFLIGGMGAEKHLDNGTVHNIMSEAKQMGKYFGAICISPRILAKAGLLENKTATGWNGDGDLPGILEANGAKYSSDDFVVDGKLITASGPPAAKVFAEAIIKELQV